ncbi:EXS-domain-containing protein, partial [Sporormia fimetaria CBS 119925]
RELDRDLVPEWRLKYLDYKLGKKKVKGIQRALRNVDKTPRLRRRGLSTLTPSPSNAAPHYSYLNRDRSRLEVSAELRTLALQNSQTSLQSKLSGSRSSLGPDPASRAEEQPLQAAHESPRAGVRSYGSIDGGMPSQRAHANSEAGKPPPSLKLPGAAMDPQNPSPLQDSSTDLPRAVHKTKSVRLADPIADGADLPAPERQGNSLPFRYRSVFSPKRVNSSPYEPVSEGPRPLLRRVFSMAQKPGPPSPGDVPMEAYRDLDLRQADFFQFLDMELEKIEAFYKMKEEEATERLHVLREQLHIMRDRRLDELITRQAAKIKAKEKKTSAAREALMNNGEPNHTSGSEDENSRPNSKSQLLNHALLNPIDTALDAVRSGKYGKATKAMTELGTPSTLVPQKVADSHRDFVRRPDLPDVPYQTARKKLKIALQEYYRGLELLKSYALLNRTAFRKINKKYDKTVNARPSMRYMTEKVNHAWFVQSDVIEGHIRTTEDLYARYFEKGNHKVAIGKLRVKVSRAGDYTEPSFRNGLFLAAGLVFGIQGLVYGAELLRPSDDGDPGLRVTTSFLLQDGTNPIQIYAGYFLMNFLFLLFCMACRVWHRAKINYVFVFEYDTRHHLDWRQLSELPCLYFFLLGLFMWLNFTQVGGEEMYHFWPVVLISLTAAILLLPLPILYFRSRQWLLYSMWRLLLAGIYPVEFRDFYMGDMFCSLTYAMGNISLFFCLYHTDWANPVICNSNHSRLMGFFSALPGVWRSLQCIRRYYDTRNVFPHLVNCGKYMATIVFYVTLSTYRIQRTDTNRAIFITFAIINSIYTSIWDVVMDWSLGDPYAQNKFLRPTLGYKSVWAYYLAMIIDPILRFNWIPYAVVPLQLQHSAVTSFCIALSEVCRRGMWTLFRVENEHCTNVGRFRASRDVPLPYDLSTPAEEETTQEIADERQNRRHPQLADHEPQRQLRPQRTRSTTHRRTASDSESPASGMLTRGLSRVGNMLRDAHAQDFERKKKPELGKRGAETSKHSAEHVGATDDDSEDDDEEEDESGSGSGDRYDGAGDKDDGEERVTDHEEQQVQTRDWADIEEVRRDVAIGRAGPASGI